jgi:hypothetical protein
MKCGSNVHGRILTKIRKFSIANKKNTAKIK